VAEEHEDCRKCRQERCKLLLCHSLLAPKPAAQGFIPLQNTEEASPVGYFSVGQLLLQFSSSCTAAAACLFMVHVCQNIAACTAERR
jgi:hypothetical protein